MARLRKNLHAALEQSVTPPDGLQPMQSLARVVQAEGNNLYTCELPASAPSSLQAVAAATGGRVLVALDSRFRNTVYMRRGGYVLVDLQSVHAPSQGQGRRVVGEIVNVVRDDKAWRKQPYWPAEFCKARAAADDDDDDGSNVGRLPPSDSEGE